jgi:hypothetical protein
MVMASLQMRGGDVALQMGNVMKIVGVGLQSDTARCRST